MGNRHSAHAGSASVAVQKRLAPSGHPNPWQRRAPWKPCPCTVAVPRHLSPDGQKSRGKKQRMAGRSAARALDTLGLSILAMLLARAQPNRVK